MTFFHVLLLSLLLTFNSIALAECQSQRVKVQVLGSGGPELTDGRASSSYLVWLDGKGVILLDAGGGSSLNYEKSTAQLNDLEVIVFSHFHVDHSASFPVYIKGSYFTHRTKDLQVFGPEGNDLMPSATEFVNRSVGENGVFSYLQNYVSNTKKSKYKIITQNISLAKHKQQNVYQSKDYALFATPVHHGPLPALAWRIDVAGCSISYSGDMNNQFQTLVELAQGSDILIAHNAVTESQKGVGRKLHMPPSEIGKIAQQAKVKKLVLSHRMSRTLGAESETLASIKKYYKGPVFFADDMQIFNVGGI